MLDDFERRGIGLISLSEATDTGTRACRVPRRTIGVLAATDHAVTAGFSSESRAAWDRTAGPDADPRPGMAREQVAQARRAVRGEESGLTEIAGIIRIVKSSLRFALSAV
jgi:hypothetical protein